MDFFDRLETREPAERECALMAALPGLIRHAQTKTPGFAELLHGVDPAAVTSRAALAQLPLDPSFHGTLNAAAIQAALGTTATTVAALVTYDEPTESILAEAPYTLTVNGIVQPGGGTP